MSARWMIAAIPACLLAGACADGPTVPQVQIVEGRIAGRVVQAEDLEPVVGVKVTIGTPVIEWTVYTGPSGDFSLGGLPLEGVEDTVFEIVAERPGYVKVLSHLALTQAEPLGTVTLALPLLQPRSGPGGDPPGSPKPQPGRRASPLEVRKEVIDFAVNPSPPRVTFQVELLQESDAEAENVVVRDSLDPEFAPLQIGDITIDRTRFPDAVVTLDPDGRQFTVLLGNLPRTDGFIPVFTVIARGPAGDGVWCNHAFVAGAIAGVEWAESHLTCYV